ncbi:hypothetical protein VA596_38230 [Amycolatopsis sp., V23-08]|uniref:Uncharacterized protein n=1 Tax=Amycolatopsis heterodermiae TaxID=3110235 RepID=A0ABU5RGX5_9PSEU|nr:hypothetical protein [Amycolatopsis sp., V23-08]MEA5365418.1 hypothetical protein [Amycolatopsis sp., V23-08]
MSARGERGRRRTRGQTALGKLPSTAAFDDGKRKSPLTLDERKLVLFLLVALADDRESLAETRRRLLDAYGARDGHWCAGKTKDALTRLLAKSLGQGATRPPPWERIVDIVEVAVPADRLPAVRAQAAALFARSVGQDRPVRGYDGPMAAPAWIEEPVVAVEMIRAGIDDVAGEPADREPARAGSRSLACAGGSGPPIPVARVPVGARGPADGGGGQPIPPHFVPEAREPRHPIDDPAALRQVLLSTSKTVCELADRIEALEASLRQEQTTNWQLRAENQRQRNLLEREFREKYSGVSLDTIRQLINEQLRAGFNPDPSSPRPLRG